MGVMFNVRKLESKYVVVFKKDVVLSKLSRIRYLRSFLRNASSGRSGAGNFWYLIGVSYIRNTYGRRKSDILHGSSLHPEISWVATNLVIN